MALVNLQGVFTGTSVLYTAPTGKKATVKYIRFNCPNAYDLTLTKFDYSLSNTATLYDLTLSAGDSVIDNTEYFLEFSDNLTVTSTGVNTSYVILLDVV